MSEAEYELAVEAQGIEHWQAAMEDDPDVMFRIIKDICKVVQNGDREGKTGRRPNPKSMGFEQLWELLFPERFDTGTFPEAFKKVLETQESQRAFAVKVPMSQSQVSKFLSGDLQPSLETIEAIARAADVSPAFFAEWRALKFGSLVSEVLRSNPDRSVDLVKRMAAMTNSRPVPIG